MSCVTARNGFTRTGYTWSSWGHQTSAGLINYGENQNLQYPFSLYTDSNVITLYAQWTSNRSSITANGNGGTLRTLDNGISGVSVASNSGWVGNYGPLDNSNIYNFQKASDGWYITSYSASSDFYLIHGSTRAVINFTATAGSSISIDVEFNWSSFGDGNSFTIGLGGEENSYALSTKTYTFSNLSAGSHYIYISFGKLGIRPTIADTVINRFNVGFRIQESGEAIGGPEWQGDNYSKTKDISYNEKYGYFPEAKRAGYSFAGWWTSITGGTQVNSNTVFQSTGGVSIYAHWTPITYTLTYNGNGGSISTTSIKYTIEDEISLISATRPAYTYIGWKTSVAAGNWVTTTIYDGNQHGKYGNVTLVAQYNPTNYILTYNPNGGTVSSTSQEYNIESSLNLPTPTRSGYTFSCWRASSSKGNWSTSVDYKGSLTGKYENMILVAQWTAIDYTVTVNSFVSNNSNGTLSYIAGLGQDYIVRTYGGTGSGVNYSITSNVQKITTNAVIGTNLEIVYSGVSPDAYLYMGRCSGTTNTNTSNPSSSAISMGYTNGAISVFFARSSANQLKYDNALKYFYFEDGVFPQTKVEGIATSGTLSGHQYNIAGRSYNGYIVGGQEYVYVESEVFKVEPIRWRVTDYGVSSSAYPSAWSLYASFNSGFTAVSDMVLNVGSAITKEMYNSIEWEDWSLADSDLPEFTNGVSINYEKSVTPIYDKFGDIGGKSVVSGTEPGKEASDIRIASKTDLQTSGLTNFDGRASDLVKHLLGCGTYASYWTTNLGTQYGAGEVMTTGNLTRNNWLYEQAGIRYAITFNEGVRRIG